MKANMTTQDFEKQLRELNPDLSIRPNNPPQRVVEMFPHLLNLASITFRGTELCSIPNYEIYDEPNGSYGVDLRADGRFIRHRTRPEALAIVKEKLQRLQDDKEYAAQFFGTGEYSDAALNAKDEPVPELVDEVKADVTEIKDGMIEGPK